MINIILHHLMLNIVNFNKKISFIQTYLIPTQFKMKECQNIHKIIALIVVICYQYLEK